MNRLKQGMAAIALVTSLGLVVPSTLGGSASADLWHAGDHNPKLDDKLQKNILPCDLNGDAGDGDEGDGYETEYELVQIGNSTMWQDKNSNTVLQFRLADLQFSTYEVVEGRDPTGTAVDFFDPIGYWALEPDGQGGQHKGQRRVLCQQINQYRYAPYLGEADPDEEHVGLVPAEFVQNTPDDSTPGFCPEDSPGPREELPECVTYLETDTWLAEYTISGAPGGAVYAASADDSEAQSADRPQQSKSKHKNGGKHRSKGKHRK